MIPKKLNQKIIEAIEALLAACKFKVIDQFGSKISEDDDNHNDSFKASKLHLLYDDYLEFSTEDGKTYRLCYLLFSVDKQKENGETKTKDKHV